MSFKSSKRDNIKKYMMQKIFYKNKGFLKDTIENFEISNTTAYRYLNDLIDKKIVKKNHNDEYELVLTNNSSFKYSIDKKNTYEDRIYIETLAPIIEDLDKNVKEIWEYAFTEMFNNVIDHAETEEAIINIRRNALYTWVKIQDKGIGIFEKIAKYFEYKDLDEAILSLFKGKLTTDRKNHSGEGIFFTSKVMDHFYAISSNKVFTRDNAKEQLNDIELFGKNYIGYKNKKGTTITMALTNESTQNLREVFDMYSDDTGGFSITKIPMGHVCDNRYPVSRSQAKTLYFGFDKFEKVILDFNGVEDIGQGFAHELFFVFENKHPEIKLEVINANDNIKKMINRVKYGV